MRNWLRAVSGSMLLATSLPACKGASDPGAAHRAKGDELFAKSQWAQAADEYGLSLQADPNQDKIWEKKAFAHMKAGNTAQAVESLLKTGDHMTDPKDKAELYRKVAGIYLDNGPVENAEKYFLEAFKADPKDDTSLSWLGEVCSQLGGARATTAKAVPAYLEKAIGYYDQAIARNPAVATPYVNKRIALLKLMDYERLEKEAAEQAARDGHEPEKIAEAKALAAKHQARADQLKRQIDDVSTKISEFLKGSKGK